MSNAIAVGWLQSFCKSVDGTFLERVNEAFLRVLLTRPYLSALASLTASSPSVFIVFTQLLRYCYPPSMRRPGQLTDCKTTMTSDHSAQSRPTETITIPASPHGSVKHELERGDSASSDDSLKEKDTTSASYIGHTSIQATSASLASIRPAPRRDLSTMAIDYILDPTIDVVGHEAASLVDTAMPTNRPNVNDSTTEDVQRSGPTNGSAILQTQKRCHWCNSDKEVNEFIDLRNPSKATQWCLECRTVRNAQTKNKKRAHTEDSINPATVPQGRKQCIACKVYRDLDQFITDRKLSSTKACEGCRIKDRERQAAGREARKPSQTWSVEGDTSVPSSSGSVHPRPPSTFTPGAGEEEVSRAHNDGSEHDDTIAR